MGTLVGLPMPQPGETITEGVVVRWIKQVGDRVGEKDAVVELETAKAVYEYESPIAGTIITILTPPGETQQVGQPLAVLECDDAAAKKYLRLGVGVALDATGAAVGGEAKIGATAQRGGSATVSPSPARPGSMSVGAPSAGSGVLFPPFIRTLAKERGLSDAELTQIPATGVGGRLTKQDVVRYLEQRGTGRAFTPSGAPSGGTAESPPSGGPRPAGGARRLPAPLPGSRRVEPTAIRRRIAENMALSKGTIPHAGSAVEVDMTALLAHRERIQDTFATHHGMKLRLAPFFLYAVREGLRQVPVCNHFYLVDDTGRHWIEEHPFIHLGVAVGTEHGLVVPVLKNAQEKDFVALARESDLLIQKALARKLTPDELSGATVTVNNPGALGSVRGAQVIAYPQAVIIGFHAIVERAAFVAGECVPRQIMEIDISFDHRLVDGVEAVRLITAGKTVLEHPAEHFAIG